MVFGQHRVPSHSSLKSADSELSSGEVPQSGAVVSSREAGHAVRQFQVLHLPSMGRTAKEVGRLRPPPGNPPATQASAPALIDRSSLVLGRSNKIEENEEDDSN